MQADRILEKLSWKRLWSSCLFRGALVLYVLFLIMTYYFREAWGVSKTSVSIWSLKSISKTISLYSADYDGLGPTGSTWEGLVSPYMTGGGLPTFRDILVERPKDEGLKSYEAEATLVESHPETRLPGLWGFAFDCRLGQAELSKIKQPEGRIEVYMSTNLDWNATDAFTSFLENPFHRRTNIAFVDGHAKDVPYESLNKGQEYWTANNR